MSDDDREEYIAQRVTEVIEGEDCEDVANALSSLLSQVIADMSESVELACEVARVVGQQMAADIAKNWHLVTARRSRG